MKPAKLFSFSAQPIPCATPAHSLLRHCEERSDEAIHTLHGTMDCFACARNDGDGVVWATSLRYHPLVLDVLVRLHGLKAAVAHVSDAVGDPVDVLLDRDDHVAQYHLTPCQRCRGFPHGESRQS